MAMELRHGGLPSGGFPHSWMVDGKSATKDG